MTPAEKQRRYRERLRGVTERVTEPKAEPVTERVTEQLAEAKRTPCGSWRERERLQELYGDPDDQLEAVVAKRDQAFAKLFYQSGWTQERLAKQEGKTQQWVARHLRLGRFLAHAPNVTMVTSGLTEGRFRSYWERTDKGQDEAARFDAVLRLIGEAPRAPAAAKAAAQETAPRRRIT